MIRIILSALFLLNAIFWGIYPVSQDSPLSKILLFFGYEEMAPFWLHLLIGTIFYILAIVICQQKIIQHLWF